MGSDLYPRKKILLLVVIPMSRPYFEAWKIALIFPDGHILFGLYGFGFGVLAAVVGCVVVVVFVVVVVGLV